MKYPVAISNYQIVKNSANNSAEIYIDGEIVDAETQQIYKDYFGDETSVSFKSFRNDLLNCGFKNVDVYCNGPGGHIGDAMAMHDMVNDLNGKGWNINTFGRGMVASALTYVAMAGKNGGEVSKNTSWLIHNVSGGIQGNVNEIENYAKTLRKFNDHIVDFYSNATGMSKTVIGNMMDAETWMIGQEIADKGFVKNCSGKDCAMKNSIPAERWPFSNMAVLNTYNSSVLNKTSDMDFKALGEKIANSIKAALGNTALTTDQHAAVTNALTEGFKEIDTAVANSVKAAMNSDATAKAVGNAIAKAFETVPENFTKAITDATSGFATKEEVETIKTDLVNKLAGQNSGKAAKVTEGGDEIENKVGWSWGND